MRSSDFMEADTDVQRLSHVTIMDVDVTLAEYDITASFSPAGGLRVLLLFLIYIYCCDFIQTNSSDIYRTDIRHILDLVELWSSIWN